MLTFCRSVLLVCMWAGDVMCDTYLLEEGMNFLVLATLVGLDLQNFAI